MHAYPACSASHTGPQYHDQHTQILRADEPDAQGITLRSLGGSGTIQEIDAWIARHLDLSNEQLELTYEKKNVLIFPHRLGWARTYLKDAGYLVNSRRGVWALTELGQRTEQVNERELVRLRSALSRKRQRAKAKNQSEPIDVNPPLPASETSDALWKTHAIETLQAMHPAAFERLAQRLLREAGFIEVHVTGRSGDGGIDGTGILRLAGIVSYRVMFQCKRYQNNVTAPQIRDFRGALVGRADRGLFITTGGFTREALQEATRDGAPTIDTLDGDQLLDKLKDLGLGIKTEEIRVEKITVDTGFFEAI
jgi:restriction system protein